MRVISGRAKGFKLRTVPGDSTRPMMDRIKENLFNLLGPHFIPGTRWLDLFAGTGQVGIEALSRGAREVIFLDNAQPAIRTIQANLEHTKLEEAASVWRIDAFAFLRRHQQEAFDVIFVAPPQYKEMWEAVLRIVDEEPDRFLSDMGFVIVQIDPKEYKELALERLELYDQRTYGSTMLCFYEKALDESTTIEESA